MVNLKQEYPLRIPSFSDSDDAMEVGIRPLIKEVAPPVLNGNPLENGIRLYSASSRNIAEYLDRADRTDPNNKALIQYLGKIVNEWTNNKTRVIVSSRLGLNRRKASLEGLARKTGQSDSYVHQVAREGVVYLDSILRGPIWEFGVVKDDAPVETESSVDINKHTLAEAVREVFQTKYE